MRLCEFKDESEYASLYSFMAPLWRETYGAILPDGQIEFLLEKYFSEDRIRAFRAKGYKYFSLRDGEDEDFGGGCDGVLVICERDGTTYLDKLYLLPEARGKGYPEFVFSSLLERFERDVTLNVNQGNARAVRCYQKNGFVIEGEERIELGGGMVNVDYRMRLKREMA